VARRVGLHASARRLAIIGSWSQPGLMSLDQTVLDTQIEQVTTARDDLEHRTHQNVRRNRAVSGIGPQWCLMRLSYTAASNARISSPTLLLDLAGGRQLFQDVRRHFAQSLVYSYCISFSVACKAQSERDRNSGGLSLRPLDHSHSGACAPAYPICLAQQPGSSAKP